MKALLLNALKVGIGALGTVFFAALATKLIALYWGVAAVGIFSIYRSLYQVATIVGSLNSQNAIIQGASIISEDQRYLYTKGILWIVLIWFFIVLLLILGLGIYVEKINFYIYKQGFWYEFIIITVSFLGVLSITLNSLLNGYHKYGWASFAKFIGSFIGFVTVGIALFLNMEIKSTIIAFLGASSIATLIFLLSYMVYKKQLRIKGFLKFPLFNVKDVMFISNLSLFSFLTNAIVVIAVLFSKLLIEKYSNIFSVGIFEAAWSISMTYTMVLLSSFGSYYLPQLVLALPNKRKFEVNLNRTLRFVLIISVPALSVLQLIKYEVIIVLFDTTFKDAVSLLKIMLIGDYFKAVAWVFSYSALANRHVKTLLVADSLWAIFFVIGSYYVLQRGYPIEFIGWIFSSLYFLYLVYFFLYIRRIRLSVPKGLFYLFIYGLVIVVCVSLINWSDYVELYKRIGYSSMLIIFYFLCTIRIKEYNSFFSFLLRIFK
jgi:O-antigen/teichoic acid export membrane protein